MKTFYSILYCTIRPNLDEKISIGIFMADGEHCKFSYSVEKLKVIKDLFTAEAYASIKLHLKSLSTLSVECMSDALHSDRGQTIFREEYFNYLSRYAQNLITYSSPNHIDLEITDSIFNALFEKFVFHLPETHKVKSRPIEVVRKRLIRSIAGKVNFDFEFQKNEIPGLIVPAKIWFIGKNEVQVTGETKDFNGAPHLIQQQINAHLFLIEKIKQTKEGKNGHFFLIGDEPEKSLIENHKLWEAIKDSKMLDMVPTNEIGRIEEYIHEHQVEPLLTIK